MTGSPRDESKGSVMLAKKGNTALVTEFIIPGEQVGSYFGNSLAVTDLNNDKYVITVHRKSPALVRLSVCHMPKA